MEPIQHKLILLSQIAKELNNQNVTWAIGASVLLYLKGITSEFHDIDLMVSEEDFTIVKEILLSLGEMQPSNPSTKYKTKYFGEFIVDGVDIDVMAGFTIIDNGKEYYFPLKRENINDFIELNGIRIPLQTITEWRHYYTLMDRADKVKMIDEWLHN